jgi:hypothetical protein
MRSALPRGANAKPGIGLDLDGVIVRPPLGWNVAISRRLDLPPLPTRIERPGAPVGWRRSFVLLRSALEVARYLARRPMPEVRDALAELATRRHPVVVSGRSWLVRALVERWLERYGLAPYVAAVYLNDVALPSAQFKLSVLQRLGIGEHVDDDGATALYLARHGIAVYLCDWPRNRGLPYPTNVQPVRSLLEVPRRLQPASAAAPEQVSSY